MIDYTNQYYYNLFREMHDAVKVTRLSDVKLVWVDEAMFTFNTFSTRAWSAKHQSIEVNDADIRIKTMAFLGAVSDNGGLEAYTIHAHAITTKEFVELWRYSQPSFTAKISPSSWTTCRYTRPRMYLRHASA